MAIVMVLVNHWKRMDQYMVEGLKTVAKGIVSLMIYSYLNVDYLRKCWKARIRAKLKFIYQILSKWAELSSVSQWGNFHIFVRLR